MAMPLKATKQELREKISELEDIIDRQNEEWNDLVRTYDELKESTLERRTEGENDTINKLRDENNQLIQDKEQLHAQLEELSKKYDEHVNLDGDEKLQEVLKDNETLRSDILRLKELWEESSNNYETEIAKLKARRGNPVKSKLSDDDVIEIYRLATSKEMSIKAIAEKYGIHTSTVSDIKAKRTRKHILEGL